MVRKDGKPIHTTHDRHNPEDPPHGPHLILTRWTSTYGGRDEVRVLAVNAECRSIIFEHIPNADGVRDVMDTRDFFGAYVPVLLEEGERGDTRTGPRPGYRNKSRRPQPPC